MNIKMNILLVVSMVLSVCCSKTETPNEPKNEEPGTIITIDVSKKTHKVLDKNPGGVVSCWLMDSDIERPRKTSFANAMKAFDPTIRIGPGLGENDNAAYNMLDLDNTRDPRGDILKLISAI